MNRELLFNGYILSYAGIIISLVLIAFILISSKNYIYILPEFFSLLAFITYIKFGKTLFIDTSYYILDKKINKIIYITYFILAIFSIVIFLHRDDVYSRPLIYFVSISLMASIISVEIIIKNNKIYRKLIFLQIIILGINLALTQLLLYPSVVGIDPAWHQMFTYEIINSGYIPSLGGYGKIPFMHLAISILSLITEYDYKISSMLSISLLFILCLSSFIFSLIKNDFGEKIGLLCTLLLIINSMVIQYTWWIIPYSFAIILLVAIIILLFKKKSVEISLLLLILAISINLSHPMASASTCLIIFIIYIIYSLRSKQCGLIGGKSISINIALIFLVFMLAWWGFASGHILIFSKLISWGFSIDYFGKEPRLQGFWISTPLIEQILDNVGLNIFILLSIIGSIYILAKYHDNLKLLSILTIGNVCLLTGFFSILLGKFLAQRWMLLSQIFLVLPASLAFFLLISTINGKTKKLTFIFVLTFLLSFFMIMASTCNIDNNLTPSRSVRYAFTDSELSGASFFVKSASKNLSSDFDFSINPSSSIFKNYYKFNNTLRSIDNELLKGIFNRDNSTKILRIEIIDKPFRLERGIYKLNYDPRINLSSSGFNFIYNNGGLIAYS